VSATKKSKVTQLVVRGRLFPVYNLKIFMHNVTWKSQQGTRVKPV